MLDIVASFCPISLSVSILFGGACLLAFLGQFVSWHGTVQRTENGSWVRYSLPLCVVFPNEFKHGGALWMICSWPVRKVKNGWG